MASNKGDDEKPPDHASGDYGDLGPGDILRVKILLHKVASFPPEIIDAILDHAEYWLRTTVSREEAVSVMGGNPQRENKMLLRSLPIGFVNPPPGTEDDENGYQCRTQIQPRAIQREVPKEHLLKLAGLTKGLLERPCRKIVFSITSHDQGWGGDRSKRGTYQSSYTWFDAGIERYDADHVCEQSCPHCKGKYSGNDTSLDKQGNLPICALRPVLPPLEDLPEDQDAAAKTPHRVYHHDLHPSKRCIQKNKSATAASQSNVIEWRWTDNVDPDSPHGQALASEQGRGPASLDGEFVRNLKVGDVVTVWGKARFGGWRNVVDSLTMDVYWAV